VRGKLFFWIALTITSASVSMTNQVHRVIFVMTEIKIKSIKDNKMTLVQNVLEEVRKFGRKTS
jgi:hypothetical protein